VAGSGRVVARLTAEEGSAPPDWQMPVNGTKGQKLKWRMHFVRWNHDRLDEKLEADITRANNNEPGIQKLLAQIESNQKNAALRAERRADLLKLIAEHPNKDRILELYDERSKPGRGKYLRRKEIGVHVGARWAVKYLREDIWPKHFGKKNRRRDETLSAEQIVAEWLGVEQDEINWKPSGKHQPSRKSRAKSNVTDAPARQRRRP